MNKDENGKKLSHLQISEVMLAHSISNNDY